MWGGGRGGGGAAHVQQHFPPRLLACSLTPPIPRLLPRAPTHPPTPESPPPPPRWSPPTPTSPRRCCSRATSSCCSPATASGTCCPTRRCGRAGGGGGMGSPGRQQQGSAAAPSPARLTAPPPPPRRHTRAQAVDFVRERLAAGKAPKDICEEMCDHCLAPDNRRLRHRLRQHERVRRAAQRLPAGGGVEGGQAPTAPLSTRTAAGHRAAARRAAGTRACINDLLSDFLPLFSFAPAPALFPPYLCLAPPCMLNRNPRLCNKNLPGRGVLPWAAAARALCPAFALRPSRRAVRSVPTTCRHERRRPGGRIGAGRPPAPGTVFPPAVCGSPRLQHKLQRSSSPHSLFGAPGSRIAQTGPQALANSCLGGWAAPHAWMGQYLSAPATEKVRGAAPAAGRPGWGAGDRPARPTQRQGCRSRAGASLPGRRAPRRAVPAPSCQASPSPLPPPPTDPGSLPACRAAGVGGGPWRHAGLRPVGHAGLARVDGARGAQRALRLPAAAPGAAAAAAPCPTCDPAPRLTRTHLPHRRRTRTSRPWT